MNIRAAIEAARAMPCKHPRLEQVTGLSPVAVRRLVIQMRREFGMRIEWNRSDGYIILDWGCISPDKLSKGKGRDWREC